ncbi:MAG: C40 family peptidase, partial [Clostridia bacterium]|nr:C40 family peptidase [Clostridia bacterium]
MKKTAKRLLSLTLTLMIVMSAIACGVGGVTASATVYASDVVSYARQFLGYPYVSNTHGPNSFDCSGFVYYVFKHFGISVPTGTAAWNNSPSSYGTVISTSTMQPGDVLLWSGHVGIFSGNGKCINAANSKDGVCEKPWVYYGSSPTVIRVYGVDYGTPTPSNLPDRVVGLYGTQSSYNIGDLLDIDWNVANGATSYTI